MLNEECQLDSRRFLFNCTFGCFSSHTSNIREVDEALLTSHDDIYSQYPTLLPRFAVATVLVGYAITGAQYMRGQTLRERLQDLPNRISLGPIFFDIYKRNWEALRKIHPVFEFLDSAYKMFRDE